MRNLCITVRYMGLLKAHWKSGHHARKSIMYDTMLEGVYNYA